MGRRTDHRYRCRTENVELNKRELEKLGLADRVRFIWLKKKVPLFRGTTQTWCSCATSITTWKTRLTIWPTPNPRSSQTGVCHHRSITTRSAPRLLKTPFGSQRTSHQGYETSRLYLRQNTPFSPPIFPGFVPQLNPKLRLVFISMSAFPRPFQKNAKGTWCV